MKHYHSIVIGSGAGAKITRPAANLGHKVAIIEKGRLGGTCLNHGCIPSKMLIHPADIISELRDAHRFDITVSQDIEVHFKNLVSRVSQTIDKDSDSIPPVYEAHPNIDLYRHEAHFVSNKIIEVNGEHLSSDKIFITAGVRAHIPNIPGLEGTPYMTYKEALRRTERPKSMIVIGGGFIAVELGYFYAMMGTKVDFIVRSSLLKEQDTEIANAFQSSFQKKFPVHLEEIPTTVKYDGQQFTVSTQDKNGKPHHYQAEALLLATGVTPNTDLLKLENTDIKCDSREFIQVDNTLQTSVPNIWAFGDIIGRHLFRHTANFEGEYVFNTAFSDDMFPKPITYPPIPQAVFSNPQIGAVGATEEHLKAAGIPYVVGKNNYAQSAMGMALLSEEGFCKLLFHRDTKILLGAHIIGKEAATMVHMCIAFMKMKATLQDMLDTIYIHPALPEIVRNAARKVAT